MTGKAGGRRLMPWLAGTIVLVAAAAALARPAPAWRVVLVDTATIVAPRLAESSGIVVSRTQPGIYWTHNDSGDGPFLYATDSTGADLGAVRVDGARARDWEDIAIGPCVAESGDCMYAGDIGDNSSQRPFVTVYRFREPAAPAGPGDTTRTVPLLDTLRLTFANGAHNAEGLAVTHDGWLLILTKPREGRVHVHRLNLANPGTGRLEDVGPIAMDVSLPRGRLLTGADISWDGSLLAARTYVSIHLYRVGPRGALTPLLPSRGVPIPVVESQGEGIAFDGLNRLVLSSERAERNHAIITRLQLVERER